MTADPARVLRVVALSGGYGRDEACARLARDPTLIASFSRALLEGVTETRPASSSTPSSSRRSSRSTGRQYTGVSTQAADQQISVAMARYIWRVGALPDLDQDQVVRHVAPTIQRYLTGRL